MPQDLSNLKKMYMKLRCANTPSNHKQRPKTTSGTHTVLPTNLTNQT